MTQFLKENTWAKYGTLLAVILIWLQASSYLFTVFIGGDTSKTTPITILQAVIYYGSNEKAQQYLFAAVLIPLAFFGGLAAWIFKPKNRSLHGDAAWATDKEIKDAGLLGEKGLIVGNYKNKYLLFDGAQHVLLSAPTRSGKGVSIVIPNLLNWPESVVVLDIKMENWDITSKYRNTKGQACYLFNPADANGKTHRYNPLGYVSDDAGKRIDDLQKIANMIFPDVAGTDPIWTATPRSLFLGITLFLQETGKLMTLGQVLRETLVEGDGKDYFDSQIKSRAAAGNPLSQPCIRALNSYTSIASENTRSGIMTSFRSRLELWMNPSIDAATSANDFDLRDVRKKRMSIYIGITPDNLERMAPLINLFFQQLIDLNTRELPSQNRDIKYTCLLLMDEFTAMGKVNILSKGISFIAGYGLRMMPIIQSPSQLVDVYGKEAADTFMTNHALNIVFPPKASELQAAREISEWLGYTTVAQKSKSRSAEPFSKRNRTESTSDQRRALLLPQEITAMGQEVEIVVLENLKPLKAKKAKYFIDSEMMRRLKETSPSLNKIRRIPKRKQLDDAILNGELAAFVPTINIENHNKEVIENEKNSKKIIKIREFVANDYKLISTIDFNLEFDGIFSKSAKDMDKEDCVKLADDISAHLGLALV